MLSDLPTLTNEDKAQLDSQITISELEYTLKSCGETAPGPDGIPYKAYKCLWKQVGPYLLEAWNYSKLIGLLPSDQRLSCITLLPKSGKDLNKIENWRPITLTNCDLKVFTKLLSNRVSKVLDKLITPSQTAYIPGRVVHDNLRTFEFYKTYCKENDIDALLISLDAKKAFDSVSHKYLHEVLRRYGFSDDFIDTVKLLYRDIKANIMINGYKSVMIKIARSVKQGDPLSCAFFILCIDPLIRRLENNQAIKHIPIERSRFTNISIKNKVSGFADDVGVAIKNDIASVEAIFDDYEVFTKLSGIELNISKTEILSLNKDTSTREHVPTTIRIKGNILKTVESIKICGITFSNNSEIAYKNNILDKITMLEKQIVKWLPRYLSTEGKLLIFKTFGLSQLIYSLQMCEIKDVDLKKIESIMFKFLWNTKWTGNVAPDRIKRNFLKLSYENGGLNVPDIKILDNAFKTKQFIRAMTCDHPINLIQKHALEKMGYFEYYKNEYSKLCQKDVVINVYQQTVNRITDQLRIGFEYPYSDKIRKVRTDLIASTDIIEYFHRKKIPLVIYRFRELANLGVETFHELLNELLYPRSDRCRVCANEVIRFFPDEWRRLLSAENDIDSSITYEHSFPSNNFQMTAVKKVSVKGIRVILRDSLPKLRMPYLNLEKFELNNINHIEHNPFLLSREALHAPRDRFYKFRVLHGDIFCNSRMFKFKMVNSPNCSICPDTAETVKHLLWDCPRSAAIWSYLNDLTRECLGGEYIDYNVIILGNPNPILAMETMIVWAMKTITSIERDHIVNNETILNKLVTLLHYEQKAFGRHSKKLSKRWGNLLQLRILRQNHT